MDIRLDELRYDAYVEAMADSEACPDCGNHMEMKTDCEDKFIVTRYVCPACGTESEEV